MTRFPGCSSAALGLRGFPYRLPLSSLGIRTPNGKPGLVSTGLCLQIVESLRLLLHLPHRPFHLRELGSIPGFHLLEARLFTFNASSRVRDRSLNATGSQRDETPGLNVRSQILLDCEADARIDRPVAVGIASEELAYRGESRSQ